ncbi:hypothetical protein MAN_10872, partial [Metarhizium hybridum]
MQTFSALLLAFSAATYAASVDTTGQNQIALWVPNPCDKLWDLSNDLRQSFIKLQKDKVSDLNVITAYVTYTVSKHDGESCCNTNNKHAVIDNKHRCYINGNRVVINNECRCYINANRYRPDPVDNILYTRLHVYEYKHSICNVSDLP